VEVLAVHRLEAGLTALAAVISPVVVAEIATPSVEALGAIADRVRAAAAIAALPVLHLEAAEDSEVAAVDDADKRRLQHPRTNNSRRTYMRSSSQNGTLSQRVGILIASAILSVSAVCARAQYSIPKAVSAAAPAALLAEKFDTPQQAADTLVNAAEQFDVDTLTKIFGADGKDVVLSGETAQDRQHAVDFAAQAREKEHISVGPKNGNRAFILVGSEDWPFPVPLVKREGKWSFDAKAGRQELLYRRIGADELDAIQLCHGYVEAQDQYALQKREGYEANQYAQRIISTPGKQDGLAWQNADGTWGGPVGEKIARAIEQGYTAGSEYHGYYFKILKGQGPAAPLGQIDFVVKGVMIGGFALVAAPARYGVTGVRTFIVSHDGVVFERDLGPNTLDEVKKMELFNPDKSWIPVQEEEEQTASQLSSLVSTPQN
jgi:hypothetical protein